MWGERLNEDIFGSKTKILIAAKNLFSQKGFESTSVDELADAAQVAKGTIYVHFKNKDEILLVLIQEALSQIRHIVSKSTLSSHPFIECFSALLQELLELIEKNKELFIILATEKEKLLQSNFNFKKEFHTVMVEQYTETQTQLTQFLQKGIQEGFLREIAPEEAAMVLMAIMYSFMSQWFIQGFTTPLTEKIGLITEYFLFGILNHKEAI